MFYFLLFVTINRPLKLEEGTKHAHEVDSTDLLRRKRKNVTMHQDEVSDF